MRDQAADRFLTRLLAIGQAAVAEVADFGVERTHVIVGELIVIQDNAPADDHRANMVPLGALNHDVRQTGVRRGPGRVQYGRGVQQNGIGQHSRL